MLVKCWCKVISETMVFSNVFSFFASGVLLSPSCSGLSLSAGSLSLSTYRCIYVSHEILKYSVFWPLDKLQAGLCSGLASYLLLSDSPSHDDDMCCCPLPFLSTFY